MIKHIALLIAVLCVTSPVFATCLLPYNVVLTGESTSSLSVYWYDFNTNADQYDVILIPFGEQPDFNNYENTTAKNYYFSGLEDGLMYQFFIRTQCSDGPSDWSSPRLFSTIIRNEDSCQLNLPIDDNNCPNYNEYIIEVLGQSGELGISSFLTGIELNVEHHWPSDLTIKLKSPSNKVITLMQNRGIGQTNLGILNSTCSSPLSFTSAACRLISEHGVALNGSFQPEESIDNLYDNSSPNGEWTLLICDKAADQVGTIHGFHLEFSEVSCYGPSDIYFQDINANSTDIIIPLANCDSLKIVYKNLSSNEIEYIVTDCKGDTLSINNLNNETTYEIDYSVICSGVNLPMNCPMFFTTLCESYTIHEDFDQEVPKFHSCSSPNLTTKYWRTYGENNRWSIQNTMPSSTLTGPNEDVSRIGNFLVADASFAPCYVDSSILMSHCFYIREGEACDMQFFTYLNGADVDSLSLQISIDGASTWSEIWHQTGNHGQVWKKTILSLDEFKNNYGVLRYVAYFRNGEYGDIAIDEITFSGTEFLVEEGYVYYVDNDLDGFGTSTDSLRLCTDIPPLGFSDNASDCDDFNPDIHPDRMELPCNLIDDNCNGLIDENHDSTKIEVFIDTIIHEKCYGSSDGEVILSANGGLAPYTFYWEDGAIASSRNNLTQGEYQVTVTDTGGCKTISDIIKIQVLQNFPGFTYVVDTATCYGLMDGSIEVVPPASGAPYTFEWSNGATESINSNLTAGIYELTLIDVNHCTIDLSFRVPAKETILVEDLESVDPLCYQENNGFIIIEASGSSGTYNYQWEDGSTSPTLDNLSAGIYQVTTTSSEGCISQDSFTLKETEPLSFTINRITSNPCYGDSKGSIQIGVTGGKSPYQVIWSNGFVGHFNDNLVAGNYSFVVEDSNGCTLVGDTIMITQPTEMQFSDIYVLPSYCSFDQSGSIGIQVEGGSGAYQYYWNNKENSDSISSLPSGYYYVTVIDEYQCKLSGDSIYVPHQQITPNISGVVINDNLCVGDEIASIQVDISNQIGDEITWYIDNVDTTALSSTITFDSLSSKNYLISAIDNFGCLTDTIEMEIVEPDSITYQLDAITKNICFGDTMGTISISASGGIGNLQYLWSDGQTSRTATQLRAGSYWLSITDDNQCTIITDEYTIIQTDSLNYTIDSLAHVSCHGANDGFIKLLPNGGYGNYTFNWSGGDTLPVIDSLQMGYYHFSLGDDGQCPTIYDSILIQEPQELYIDSLDIINATCVGENGQVTFIANGGSGIYQPYLNGNIATQDDLSSIPQGNHQIFIIDQNACISDTLDFSVNTENADINLDYESENVQCYDENNGTLELQVNPELIGPFQWILGQDTIISDSTTVLFDFLEPNTYTAYFMDSNGCGDTIQNITIGEPSEVKIYNVSTEQSICTSSNGKLDFTVFGAAIDYDVFIDGVYTKKSNLKKLDAGNYTVFVKDSMGCRSDEFEITIDLLQYHVDLEIEEINEPRCYGDYNGSIKLIVESDSLTSPYKWTFNQYSIATPSHKFSSAGLASGYYNAYFEDDYGCKDSLIDIYIPEPDSLDYQVNEFKSNSCYLSTDGILSIEPQGGTAPYEYQWNHNATDSIVHPLLLDEYQLTITDDYGCQVITETFKPIYPDSLYFNAQLEDSQINASTGSIQIQGYGGTQPYTYHWDAPLNNQNSDYVDKLAMGYYHFELIDANGCSKDSLFFVNGFVSNYNIEGYEVNLYPNPTTSNLFVRSNMNIQEISIYHTSGSMIYAKKVDNHSGELNLWNYPSGTYILKIVLLRGEVIWKRVIKW